MQRPPSTAEMQSLATHDRLLITLPYQLYLDDDEGHIPSKRRCGRIRKKSGRQIINERNASYIESVQMKHAAAVTADNDFMNSVLLVIDVPTVRCDENGWSLAMKKEDIPDYLNREQFRKKVCFIVSS